VIDLNQSQTAVTILAAAFRSSMSEETAELLLRRFTQEPFRDYDILMATIGAAVDMLDYLPTVHQLVDAYQAEARHRMEMRRQRDQRALDAAGPAHGRLPGTDQRLGKAMAGVLREGLTVALGGGAVGDPRGHFHMRGVDPQLGREVETPEGPRTVGLCPVCSRSEEIAETMRRKVAELMSARQVIPVPQPVPLRQCHRCDPTMPGFVPVDDEPGSFSVKPCPGCGPEAHERWAGGELGARHGVTR
jgi:hypothetical protein